MVLSIVTKCLGDDIGEVLVGHIVWTFFGTWASFRWEVLGELKRSPDKSSACFRREREEWELRWVSSRQQDLLTIGMQVKMVTSSKHFPAHSWALCWTCLLWNVCDKPLFLRLTAVLSCNCPSCKNLLEVLSSQVLYHWATSPALIN
jgi:hypothetical protein